MTTTLPLLPPTRIEMIDNAYAFILDSILNNGIPFEDAASLDEMSIAEFGDDFDFMVEDYSLAIKLLQTHKTLSESFASKRGWPHAD